MERLLLATNNPGKVAELRPMLQGCGWEVVTPGEIGVELPQDETGDTYAANAAEKALRGIRDSGLVTLADDSGLEIEALGGEPGVHSAVFLGPEATYEERFAEIYRRLASVPPGERRARFVCVMAIADPESGNVRLSEGEIRGLIAEPPRGERGFGYDPVFWSPHHSATMAELPQHEKDIISHRARAAAGARQILREVLYEKRGRHPSYVRHE